MSDTLLREADRLSVTVQMDNYTDMLLMQGNETVRRPMLPPPTWLLAEHGLSCLVTVGAGTRSTGSCSTPRSAPRLSSGICRPFGLTPPRSRRSC